MSNALFWSILTLLGFANFVCRIALPEVKSSFVLSQRLGGSVR